MRSASIRRWKPRVAAELAAAGLLATPERPQPRCMEHADLARLTYLQCVIKVGSSAEPGVPACAPIICTLHMAPVHFQCKVLT